MVFSVVAHDNAPAIRLYPHTAAVYLPNGLPPAPPYQGKPGFFRQGNLGALENVVASGGTVDNHVITWQVGAVAPGASGTVSFTAQVPANAPGTVQYCNVGVFHPGSGESKRGCNSRRT